MRRLWASMLVGALWSLALPVTTARGQVPTDKFFRASVQTMALQGRYIVVLRDTTPGSSVAQVAASLAATHGGNVTRIYRHAIKGFAIQTTETAALNISRDQRVEFVEEDSAAFGSAQPVSGSAAQAPALTVQPTPAAGLDRIDQRRLPLSCTYRYAATGEGVNVYVIDSAVQTTHPDFEGRASSVFDAVRDGRPDPSNDALCASHGTAVASIIGGKTVGVAKKTRLFAVRVSKCSSNTQKDDVSAYIEGVDWVTGNHVKPAVANMSIGAPPSRAFDKIVRQMIRAGVVAVSASPDKDKDACRESPSRVLPGLTVSSTDRDDTKPTQRAFGTCLDLFAPGEASFGAVVGGGFASFGGTSGAAPYVAGVAALYLQMNPAATPEVVNQIITSTATQGVVQNRGTGSPNRLLYSLLSVGQGTITSNPPLPSATATPLQFTAPLGGSDTKTFTIGSTGDPLEVNVESTSSCFLKFDPPVPVATSCPPPSQTPFNLKVTADASNPVCISAPGGPFQTQFTIKTNNGSPPVSVVLQFTVTAAPTGAVIQATPANLTASAVQGGLNPSAQTLSIVSTGGPLNWNASDNATWLSVTPGAGTTPTSANVSFNTAGLGAGIYDANVSVAVSSTNRVDVPVRLTVAPAGATSLLATPSSLSFAATQGGANPPAKSLNISSTGNALNWSASDNASWLSVSPVSNLTPSATTVSVNAAGLNPGNYNATINVAATGATNSPVSIPVSLSVSASGGGGGGGGALVNGGFEGGPAPWVFNAVAAYAAGDGLARSGSGYGSLPLDIDTSGNFFQQFTVPTSIAAPKVTFYLNVSSSLNTTTAFDKLFVDLTTNTGALLQILATYSNLDKGTPGVYTLKGPFDLSEYKGQTVRLRFRGLSGTTFGGQTTFRIDDVSVN